MGNLIGWLIGKRIFGKVITERGASIIAHVGLVLTVVAMLGGIVAWIRSDAVSDHQAKMERGAAPATNKAADERARDTVANSKSAQEMHDVIAAEPDQPIAPTTRALSCERLRRLGRNPPACR